MKTKNSVLLFISFIFVFGCSTNSDSNNTTVVPIAPSNLTGTVVSATQINFSWMDNSTNETGFKIERKTGTGIYTVVGNIATDITTFNDNGLTPNTTYAYRVFSSNAVGNSLTYSNELTLTTNAINLPSLTTTAVSSIATSVVSGGTISSDGGASITARGVCWSASTNPTTALSTKTTNGAGTGVFSSIITGLTANTTYYIRAYATNSVGTAYGTELSFTTSNTSSTSVTDIDGNTYSLITICNQTWMQSNLNVSKYRNGDVIPQVTDMTQWEVLTTGAWCYYENTSSNGTTYGKLYNWHAVNDPRGLAPEGYHIPSDAEWSILTSCLGGESIAGGKMKETGNTHWLNSNTVTTNSSGFTGLPGGYHSNNGNVSYYYMGLLGYFWSTTQSDSMNAWFLYLSYSNNSAYSTYLSKTYGFSVRCLKD